MDHRRKMRWVRYHHIKCKMYLRNDFRFECAYCRMREQDVGTLGEEYFEKDHFVAKASKAEIDFDSYDNMVYACSKCNRNKSDKNVELLLNPCKDDIYSGVNPHVKSLGKNGHFQLIGNTDEGWKYIDTLQLNSKFYREMRKKQEQADKDNNELEKLIDEISGCPNMSDDLLQKLKLLVHNNFLIQTNIQQDIIFKCGHSKAGQAFIKVLDILDNLAIAYELQFADKDIDIKIQYNSHEYLCEIVLNDKAEKPVRCIHIKREQRESWAAGDGNHGILYFYVKTGRLEFYQINGEKELMICLKDY